MSQHYPICAVLFSPFFPFAKHLVDTPFQNNIPLLTESDCIGSSQLSLSDSLN